MGLLKFCTKKTFIEVDVSNMDGSSKDARKIQSWGGPACSPMIVEDASTDCSDEDVLSDVDDWQVGRSDRFTTAFFEDDWDAHTQAELPCPQGQGREEVHTASPTTMPVVAPASPPLQPANVVFVQCPFVMTPMVHAPVNAMQTWSLPNSSGTSSSHAPSCSNSRDSQNSTTAANEGANSTWTSRMVRNIPNDYTRQDFLDLLNQHSIAFDFVYLPMDWHKAANLGYAFVNLVSHEEALRLADVLNGFTDWTVQTQKICEVVWGKPQTQSLERIVGKFRNSPVMHPDVPDTFKPVLFNAGRRVPFPAPTVELQKLRGSN